MQHVVSMQRDWSRSNLSCFCKGGGGGLEWGVVDQHYLFRKVKRERRSAPSDFVLFLGMAARGLLQVAEYSLFRWQ